MPSRAFEWPAKPARLRALSDQEWDFWRDNGYCVVRSGIPTCHLQAVVGAIHGFLGSSAHDWDSWYRWEYDIYSDTVRQPDGREAKPPHGPCGMVQMCHHRSMWANRQWPRVHDIFSDIYGTHRLWVTSDRTHFKPPERADKPAWSDAGLVHSGLHWDTQISVENWPVPYGVQALLCLTDTPPERGALRLVPGFQHAMEQWVMARPNPRQPFDEVLWNAPEAELPPSVSVGAKAGDLVIWHSCLPHGPGRNTSALPRYSQYISMIPVDAPRPTGMNDAGTLHGKGDRRNAVRHCSRLQSPL
eukprot:COSAG01_NODE_7313_length_3256_cov_1.319607_2_plen_301_part_00